MTQCDVCRLTQAVTVELKHDDKLTDEDGVYVQAALLYTACSGQRRLRVLNLALSVCTQMADLYRSCELDTITNLMLKQGTPVQHHHQHDAHTRCPRAPVS